MLFKFYPLKSKASLVRRPRYVRQSRIRGQPCLSLCIEHVYLMFDYVLECTSTQLDYKSYYHECFLRGRPELTKIMNRLTNPGKRLPDKAGEPDFYSSEYRRREVLALCTSRSNCILTVSYLSLIEFSQ